MSVSISKLRIQNLVRVGSKINVQNTGLSESQTSLCVSKISISISAVFPWCRWPTTATLRIISGNAVMFNKNLPPSISKCKKKKKGRS